MTLSPLPPLPSLPMLLGQHQDAVLADCRSRTGDIRAIQRLTGGNVSHVFRAHGGRGTAIIKVRQDRFARIPSLETDPALIADERRALRLYADAAPGHFPHVLGFHRQAHAMVLTDVFSDGLNYHQHLARRPATPEEMTRLGRALRAIHQATRNIRTQIRSQGDAWFREHTFDYCLRAHGHETLNAACEQMAAQPGQQLILGDLAPKNMSLNGGVALCDLDNVHRGWPLYDVGYVLAHLLIHHLACPDTLRTLVPALLRGYFGAEEPDETQTRLMATVTAGVILYRLAPSLVPYPLNQPAALTDRYRDRTRELLDSPPLTVPILLRAVGAQKDGS
ncbi:phosphotransferase [Streptomyces sp. NPDC059994]|uniref:phosphotransferase n=1 Tax=Streptomyces sp. NPDC059994 TaxID=3347029 RepID=UPI0036CB02B1